MRMHMLVGMVLMAAVLLGQSARGAPMPIPEKAKAQAAVFKQELKLSDEQTAGVEAALVEKLTVGKEAYQKKQDGDEEGAQALWKESGGNFYQAMVGLLTKEQMAIYKTTKDALMIKVNEIK